MVFKEIKSTIPFNHCNPLRLSSSFYREIYGNRASLNNLEEPGFKHGQYGLRIHDRSWTLLRLYKSLGDLVKKPEPRRCAVAYGAMAF